MNRFSFKNFAPIALAILSLFTIPLRAAAFEVILETDQSAEAFAKPLSAASLVLAAKRDGVTSPQEILAAARADYGRLVGALNELGYFGPVVSIHIDGQEAARIPPLAVLSGVSRVEINVSAGPAFHFGQTEIAPLMAPTEIPPAFQTGAAAETAVIREVALAGLTGWRSKGYAQARIDQQNITANHQNAQLDVQLRIAPGPLVQFGPLKIAGANNVREARIREIAAVNAGEVFSPEVLARAAARLRRTGAFRSVSLQEPDTLGAGDSMEIELTVVEAKPRRFGFGAELQSSEGLALSGFWMHRNFLGGAERFRLEGDISGLGGETDGIDYHLRASCTRPSTFHSDMDLYIRADLEQLNDPTYFARQASAEVGLSRYFSDTLSAEAGVMYRYSDVSDDLGSRQFSILALPLGLTWDRRDDALNPTSGTYVHAEIMPFLGLDASASGGRGYLDARIYRGLGAENGIILAGRLQFGTVLGSTVASTAPDLLFFSGGSGTVRGHSYQSLSFDSGGIETGGRSFIGFAGEARVKVSEAISAVAFYDAGYIGGNSWIDDTGSWHSGAGLGLRYQTGIGPIRLDIATPITGDSTRAIQYYIGIGQAF